MTSKFARRRLGTALAATVAAAALLTAGIAPATAAEDLDGVVAEASLSDSFELDAPDAAGDDAPVTTAATKVTPAQAPGAAKWGVYEGPGAATADGASDFAEWTGLNITRTLDFPPQTTWDGHTGFTNPGWILEAHEDTPYRLEYSLPMLPDDPTTNLEDCAAGEYNTWWTKTAKSLIAAGQANAFVRPGWEMNGLWYRWSAVGKAQAYIGCFQQIVTTMRATNGARFAFTWNPNAGSATMKGEEAYPGDAFVDVVGIDVYDHNWSWYPVKPGMTNAQARAKAWAWTARGDHGLNYWRDFAKSRKKRLALPEWGMSHRNDGHGGGDNTLFMGNMLDFIADPANSVAYTNYFNIDGVGVRHDLQDGRFPRAAQLLKDRAEAMTP